MVNTVLRFPDEQTLMEAELVYKSEAGFLFLLELNLTTLVMSSKNLQASLLLLMLMLSVYEGLFLLKADPTDRS